ncbi:MAG TPA: FAD-dependent oxidoreductase [Xanthobacteraceae bacterium]|jgi:thioredoxin reductase (NADPH)
MTDYDLVVIGAGVAGLTAGMFAARHGLKVVVVDRMGAGGQIINAERIENWPGFPQGIGGHELGPLLHEQAEAAGAEIVLDTIEAIELAGEHRVVRGATDVLRAGAVIIAAGSEQRRLGIPGEELLRGKGVSHCASCDGAFFTGRDVCVVGGGDSALDEALVLAEHAARVTVFHRGPRLDAQQALRDRIAANPKVEVVLDTVVEEIRGEGAVSGVRLRALGTGVTRLQQTAGVFIYVGLAPNTAFLRGLLGLDASGHIETDASLRTSVEGIFAAGDIRKFSVAQLAAAAGDGATAAISAYRYLARRG